MVRMSQFNDKVKEFKKSFNSLTKHSYLEKYIQVPNIDEDKMRFLYAMLSEHATKKEAKVFTLSALLVQAALDVHEAVSLQKLHSDSTRKNRQLTVLAGDYYSSLYYYLLAEGKYHPMIQIFSRSIQEINEYKMNLYDKDGRSYDEIKSNVEKIESILMQNIAHYYEQTDWKEIFNDYFYLKRLVREKEQYKVGEKLPLIDSLYQETKHPELVMGIWEQKIEEVKDRLLKTSKRLHKFEGFIIEHVDRLVSTIEYEEFIAEKG